MRNYNPYKPVLEEKRKEIAKTLKNNEEAKKKEIAKTLKNNEEAKKKERINNQLRELQQENVLIAVKNEEGKYYQFHGFGACNWWVLEGMHPNFLQDPDDDDSTVKGILEAMQDDDSLSIEKYKIVSA